MDIISFRFVLFVLVVIFVYSRLSLRAQNIWLLTASYFFCFTWGWKYALVLLAVTLSNYRIGLWVDSGLSHAKKWLYAGILINAGSLVVLKLLSSAYSKFLVDFFNWGPKPVNWTGILLPIGFSFYILQAISYLVDVSRGQTAPISDIVNFALYLSYFPKILSGPLERAGRFIPQLIRERKVNNRQLGYGFGLILVGLLRKVVISGNLTIIRPPNIFAQPAEFSTMEHIVWLVVFAFMVYNDFAGYTSIVRGVSALMGIELSANFAQPFFAKSFTDFWNRWHISLSSWFRDYVFFPVRRWGMKHGISGWIILIFLPLITMLVSGFWHGASLAMLVWGGLHGIYQMMDQVLRRFTSSTSTFYRFFSTLMVFVLVTLAWIPFASVSFHQALKVFQVFILPFRFSFPSSVWINIVVVLGLSLGLDWQEYKTSSDSYFLHWPAKIQTLMVFLVLLVLAFFAGNGPDLSNFIYQGF